MPPAAYGTVSQEASEITLADEPTVDLSSGGLKRKADIPFGSPVWIAETLQSTIGNAQWRADTLAQIHHEVNTAQSRASAWWAGATPEERAKAGGASGVILLILLWLFGAFSNSEEFAPTSAVAAAFPPQRKAPKVCKKPSTWEPASVARLVPAAWW